MDIPEFRRRRPYTVQAVQYTDETREWLIDWTDAGHQAGTEEGAVIETEILRIPTRTGGRADCRPGDYVVYDSGGFIVRSAESFERDFVPLRDFLPMPVESTPGEVSAVGGGSMITISRAIRHGEESPRELAVRRIREGVNMCRAAGGNPDWIVVHPDLAEKHELVAGETLFEMIVVHHDDCPVNDIFLFDSKVSKPLSPWEES